MFAALHVWVHVVLFILIQAQHPYKQIIFSLCNCTAFKHLDRIQSMRDQHEDKVNYANLQAERRGMEVVVGLLVVPDSPAEAVIELLDTVDKLDSIFFL